MAETPDRALGRSQFTPTHVASAPCQLARHASCPAATGWLPAMARDRPRSSPTGREAIASQSLMTWPIKSICLLSSTAVAAVARRAVAVRVCLTKPPDRGKCLYAYCAPGASAGGAAMYVSLETLRRAVSLVDSLAQLDDPACFAGIVLPGLSTLVGCDVLTYNEIGSAPGETRYADYPAGALDPATQLVFAAHVHEHPLVNHYRATGSGEPVMISDFLSRQRFHRLGLYAEFFRGIPVEHQMAISLPGPDEQVIGVVLSRACRDFCDSDRALLSALRAPLVAALQRARRRQQAGQVLSALACSGLASLTDREIQIMRLVAAGRTNIAIAHKLEVSPRTIAKHLEHIYRKLGVSSRAAAVSRIALAGAQDPSPRRGPDRGNGS